MKVMTILGTRPEIIRLSRVMAVLDQQMNHVIVHTGQNYDYELNEIFYAEMGLRKPDHFLSIDTSSLGRSIADIIRKSETVLRHEKPDAVLILGDTNSSLASIMAKRLKIPIYHMEAGNRCFDFNVPEEINRRIVDHISDFNLVYTEHARRNLLREGLHPRRIYLTGSPLGEVIDFYLEKIRRSNILKTLGLQKRKYFIVSAHREENVDSPMHLKKILSALEGLMKIYKLPMIVSTHPRTQKRLNHIKKYWEKSNVFFLKPFGFFDYSHLLVNSFCAMSDSGTISEEAALLSFPAITFRNAMERPEAMDTGNIILTGLEPDTVAKAVKMATSMRSELAKHIIPAEYAVRNTSQRVAKLIVGTARLSRIWAGLFPIDSTYLDIT